MKLRNAALVAGKEFAVGPRGMMFVFVLVVPLLITLIVRLVFGGLASPTPRLGVVDEGASSFVSLAGEAATLEVERYPSEERLRAAVAANDEDAGLVLQSGFDEMVRGGKRPELRFFVSGRARRGRSVSRRRGGDRPRARDRRPAVAARGTDRHRGRRSLGAPRGALRAATRPRRSRVRRRLPARLGDRAGTRGRDAPGAARDSGHRG